MRGSPGSRRLAFILPSLLALGASAFAFDGDGGERDPNPTKKAANLEVTPDSEAAALAFVRQNHPELAVLLKQLKAVKPAEYDRAVRELAQVSKTLGALKARNPQAYERSLDVWKSRSRVELLTAKLASAPSPELESELRRAVEDQLDSEIRQQKFERSQVEARLKKIKENLDRLESRRDSIVESRYQAFVKKGQRARQQKRPKADDASRKSKSKPTAKGADPAATTTKGERQP